MYFYASKIAEVSTGHVTAEDGRLIRKRLPEDCMVTVLPFPEGAFVYWPVLDAVFGEDRVRMFSELRKAGFSPAFCDLVQRLLDSGYRGMLLDCDAPFVDGLQQFDWREERA